MAGQKKFDDAKKSLENENCEQTIITAGDPYYESNQEYEFENGDLVPEGTPVGVEFTVEGNTFMLMFDGITYSSQHLSPRKKGEN